LRLILLEGIDKIEEGLGRQAMILNRLSAGEKHGMATGSIGRFQELVSPPIQQPHPVSGIPCRLISEIIRPSAKGIDVGEILSQRLGQQPTGDRKIFVVPSGQLTTIPLGLFQRIAAGESLGAPRGQAGVNPSS
jgi:hypothetical protein